METKFITLILILNSTLKKKKVIKHITPNPLFGFLARIVDKQNNQNFFLLFQKVNKSKYLQGKNTPRTVITPSQILLLFTLNNRNLSQTRMAKKIIILINAVFSLTTKYLSPKIRILPLWNRLSSVERKEKSFGRTIGRCTTPDVFEEVYPFSSRIKILDSWQ